MSYLWEDYSVNENYSLAVRGFSPYMEVFHSVDGNARVNIMHRFEEFYGRVSELVLDSEYEGNVSLKNAFHVLFHMLANVDFYSGLTLKDAYMMKMEKEILVGRYGMDTELFGRLSLKHRYTLLSYLYLKRNDKNKGCLFFDFLTDVFGARLMYSEFADTYIVQIGCKKEMCFDEDERYCAGQLYELAKDALCDFWLAVEVYWDVPIGIIDDAGAQDGMEIDRIQII